MAKLPYFRFFPSDWMGSPKVIMMDDAECGVYIKLLAVAWSFPGCCLPLDPEVCRRLIGSRRVARVARVLELCFEKTENGWRNERERNENDHATSKHDKAVLSAKSLWNKKKGRANAERTQSERNANQILEPEEPIVKPTKKPVNPSVHVLQQYLKSAFEKKFGDPPVMNYPAIGKQLRTLLERDRFTEDALKEAVDWFLTSPKAQEHPTPAAAISADTIQRWQAACPEEK
jgi:uncharacterized protein YdaU (DUF1376 family)